MIGHVKKELFMNIKEKLASRVEGWEGKVLSKAGKEIVLKTVALAMPNFAMACFKLPITLCKEINSLLARYWWSSKGNSRGIHWMKWSKLSVGKKEGGLGFRDLIQFNLAMLAKQGWRLVKNENCLMARVFRGKYFYNGNFMNAKLGGRPLWAWRSILEAKQILKAGMRWKIGNGRSIKAFEDQWLPKPITFRTQSVPIPEMANNIKVADLICSITKNWDGGKVGQLFSAEEALMIKSIPLSWFDKQDELIWHYTSSGSYTVSSGYITMRMLDRNGVGVRAGSGEQSNSGGQVIWTDVWGLDVPHKLQHFVWQCVHDILPIGKNLAKRGMGQGGGCCFCADGLETELHLFLECQFARMVWFCSSLQLDTMLFNVDSFSNWWTALKTKLSGSDDTKENLSKVYVLWRIWKARNDKIFNGNNWDPMEVARKADRDSTELRMLLSDERYCAKIQQENRNEVEQDSLAGQADSYHEDQSLTTTTANKWQPPGLGWIKINVDSSWDKHTNAGGLGLVVRDDRGRFVVGKSMHIECICSSQAVEALAVREGASFALELGLQKVVFESDAQGVINHLNHEASIDHCIEPICSDVRRVVEPLLCKSFIFVHRRFNCAADLVAKNAATFLYSHTWFNNPPPWLEATIKKEGENLFG